MDAKVRSVSSRDGKVRAEFPVADEAAVRAAVARCRAAQESWAHRDVAERGKVLGRVRRRFLEAAERIVDTLVDESGKPEAEAWLAEIVPNDDLFRYWIRHAARYLKPERIRPNPLQYRGKSGVIEYAPRGVVGLVSPWNFPVSIPLRTIVPALMAGNGVVFKPSEHAARTGALLGELFAAEGPPGLVQVVHGAGDTGRALVTAGVDLVVFTGSVATGRKVAALAGEHLVPVSLELGGKDAAIVLADADLERTARGIVWGAMANAGQNCAAIERVYVEESVAAPFLEKVREIVAGLGPDDVGPLTIAAQRDHVERQLREAAEAGARIVVGGKRREGPGFGLEPTVVTDVRDDGSLMVDETFGPVLPVRVVRDADEAVGLVNRSAYGLTASVWTRDRERGRVLAQRLETGVVTVNNHGFTAALPQAPWTGVKDSGFGVTNSHLAFRELVRPRFVLVDRSRSKRELWWYPYDRHLVDAGRALRDLSLGHVAAVGRLAWSLLRRAIGR